MSDIVLNKDIAGGVTNFQVVGCTIDVGTKIYAARVDALHQNTYKMLSGLGTNSNQDDGEANQGENGADMDQTGFQGGEDGEEGGAAGPKDRAAERRPAAPRRSAARQALGLLPADHPSCAATADKVRQRLAGLAGLAGGGGGERGLLDFGMSPQAGLGGLAPLTPCSLMLAADAACEDLQARTPPRPEAP